MTISQKKLLLCLSCLLLMVFSFANSVLAVEVRNKDEVLQQIDEHVTKTMKINNIEGAALSITNNDGVFYAKGYGADSEGDAITGSTPLPIASLSKSFTALAVLQLVETGQIKLDAPFTTYFSDAELSPMDKRVNEITIRQLLHQTSGLRDKVNPDMTQFPQYETLQETITSLNKVKLAHDPGAAYSYHNPNYQYLALLVEKVSGQRFSSYLEEHIFKPLGMNQTVNVSTTQQINDNDAIPKGHYLVFGHSVSRAEPNWFVDGPAGMISTAEDMGKWMLAQYNGRILASELMAQYHAAGQGGGPYGMGWIAGEDERWGQTISHGGIFWTYKAEEIIFLDQQLGITMMFNTGLNAFVDYAAIVNGVAQIMMGEKAEPSTLNSRNMEIAMIVLLIAAVIWGVYGFIRRNQRKKRITIVGLFISSIVSLLPMLLLLFLSPIATFIGGGRVVPLFGLWMAMPSMIIFLAVLSLVSVTNMVCRIHFFFKIRVKTQPM
ncbi:beta-lactamase family protein [Paenibacillus sp. SC116]|uniref:serine hydrolase domain-containing protein n=1 Tax=Paenibacillus sp. SC116 TaxID=2968986 RepID=UPI00215A8FC5|nr:serine hydrolase domain-containing protein [Paenibacillus sp. SC116]MCR8843607.1 beta-lactamase family protein [Paenibacillus sp. SC116]